MNSVNPQSLRRATELARHALHEDAQAWNAVMADIPPAEFAEVVYALSFIAGAGVAQMARASENTTDELFSGLANAMGLRLVRDEEDQDY